MSDAVFIATVIYACYVIYIVSLEEETPQKQKPNASTAFKPTVDIASPSKEKVAAKAVEKPAVAEKKTAKITEKPVVAVVKETPVASVVVKKTPVAPVVVKKEKAVKKRTAAPKVELRSVVMKHPVTGEQAKVSNNYRMTKRWVKEALVEENLLEKIYKNTELDEAAKIKVSYALSIIKAMDKYK